MSQYFAKIKDNQVVDVRVVTREFLEANPERYTGTWVEMFIDQKLGHGGVGSLYDSTKNVFYSPQPFPSFTLDSNYEWQPPIPKPEGRYQWFEPNQQWIEIVES